jgi:hypothetical protein
MHITKGALGYASHADTRKDDVVLLMATAFVGVDRQHRDAEIAQHIHYNERVTAGTIDVYTVVHENLPAPCAVTPVSNTLDGDERLVGSYQVSL